MDRRSARTAPRRATGARPVWSRRGLAGCLAAIVALAVAIPTAVADQGRSETEARGSNPKRAKPKKKDPKARTAKPGAALPSRPKKPKKKKAPRGGGASREHEAPRSVTAPAAPAPAAEPPPTVIPARYTLESIHAIASDGEPETRGLVIVQPASAFGPSP